MSTNGTRADLERKEDTARPKLPENPFCSVVRVTTWEREQEKLSCRAWAQTCSAMAPSVV